MRGLCLPGTRDEILNDITNWWREDDAALRVYWISGGSGRGKSTIARTMASNHASDGSRRVLGASFAFPIGGRKEAVKGRSMAAFCKAIATELGTRIPEFGEHIRNVINDDDNIWLKSAVEQWRRLVLAPLQELLPSLMAETRLVVLVVEAVDECSDVGFLIKLLTESSAISGIQLRVLLTSMREPRQCVEFDRLPEEIRSCCKLRDISDDEMDDDVYAVLCEELRNIRAAHGLSAEWLGDGKIQKIRHMAGQSFIYAVTACRLIQAALTVLGAEQALEMVIENSSSGGKVDGLYNAVLKHTAKGLMNYDQGDTPVERVLEVAGAVVDILAPLSVAALAELIAIDLATVSHIVKSLSPVFYVPEDSNGDAPIHLVHSSFRTFFFDPCRAESQFRLSSKETHHNLQLCCLQSMVQLKKDISNFRNSGALASEVAMGTKSAEWLLPPHLRYSCQFWTDHLRQSQISLCDDDEVHRFLRTQLLHWVEALGWMGIIVEGVQALQVVKDVIRTRVGLDDSRSLNLNSANSSFLVGSRQL